MPNLITLCESCHVDAERAQRPTPALGGDPRADIAATRPYRAVKKSRDVDPGS